MSHATHTHSGSHGASGEVHPEVGHLVPASVLVATGTALLILTVITVAVRYVDVGEFNIHIALGIALVKALLVCLFFMHLRWDRPFNALMMVACVLFVLLFMAFTVMDTTQYKSLQFRGNPKDVQKTLEAEAPGAPIARDVQYAP